MKKYNYLKIIKLKEQIKYTEETTVFKEVSFLFGSTGSEYSFNCKAIVDGNNFKLLYNIAKGLKLLFLNGNIVSADELDEILRNKFEEVYFQK